MINSKKYSLITCNSKEVKPNSIFVAIKGFKLNGEDFVSEALANGAGLVVVSNEFQSEIQSDKIKKVANPRQYLSLAARDFYGKQPEQIVAVTGTNGKTSTANFFKQISVLSGFKGAAIGTLGVICDDVKFNNNDTLTSPDPVKLHKILNTLAESKITHVALEASSIGLEQFRLDGVNIKAAAFTNLTRDHIDYHGSMEQYYEAKLRLFRELAQEYAVLNADVPQFSELLSFCKSRNLNVISYGRKGENIKLIEYKDQCVTLFINGKKFEADLNLAGDFQVYNVMCALGLAIAVGIPTETVIDSLPKLRAASGRLEMVGQYNGAKIFVDYAHTPDALENVLNSLKHSLKGKLHVVFGCGGDRDQGKRPIMGDIAQKLADVVVVTDDNPRTEEPAKIRKQILQNCPKAVDIGDRSQAIRVAIENLKPQDILLIAGKGHEDYQIIGTEKKHFSDQQEVRNYLKELDA